MWVSYYRSNSWSNFLINHITVLYNEVSSTHTCKHTTHSAAIMEGYGNQDLVRLLASSHMCLQSRREDEPPLLCTMPIKMHLRYVFCMVPLIINQTADTTMKSCDIGAYMKYMDHYTLLFILQREIRHQLMHHYLNKFPCWIKVYKTKGCQPDLRFYFTRSLKQYHSRMACIEITETKTRRCRAKNRLCYEMSSKTK